MNESLFDVFFSSINISLSILLLIIFLYWIVTFLFGLDLEVDFDLDVGVDTDVNTGVGVDADHLSIDEFSNAQITKETIRPDRRKPLKWWQVVLVFFNFVELPFMFTFTCWIFLWWFITVLFTYLTGSYNNFFGFIIFLVGIVPSLFLTRFLTTPFKKVFRKFEKNGEESLEIVGRIGETISNFKGDRVGTVKLVIDTSPITIYGKSMNGELIESGKEVLIIKESTDKKYFYIQPYHSN